MTKVPTALLSSAKGVRLDAEFGIFVAGGLGNGGPRLKLSELVSCDWISPIQFPKCGGMYCEIGDIDSYGRVCPTYLHPDMECDDPETAKQMERKLKKVFEDEKSGVVKSWSVLVPKTRPYQRKFGIVTGQENCFYTTDLIVVRPKEKFAQIWNISLTEGVSSCLLYLLLKRGQLGDLLAAVSRWGKSYPTVEPDDIEMMDVGKDWLTRWVDRHDAVAVAKDMCRLLESIQKKHSKLQEYILGLC